jgi:hypothetical protein
MDVAEARAFAELVHANECEPDGTPLLNHVRRVAHMVPAEARPTAWLHEALESPGVTEQDLLMADLTTDELRALRLLCRTSDARSVSVYLAHVDLIGCAAGRSGYLARLVKVADLEDRCLHPRVRRDGWSPPYDKGLELLRHRTRAGTPAHQGADALVPSSAARETRTTTPG